MRYSLLFGLLVLMAVDAKDSTPTSKSFLDKIIDWFKGDEEEPEAAPDDAVSSLKDDSLQDGLPNVNTLLGNLFIGGSPPGQLQSLEKPQDRSDPGASMSSVLQMMMNGLTGQGNSAGQLGGSLGDVLKPPLDASGGQSNGQKGMNYLQSLMGILGGQGNGQAGMDLQSLLRGLGGQSNGPGGMDLQSLLGGLGGQSNGPGAINLQSLLSGLLGGQSNGPGGMDLQSLLGGLGGQSNGPGGLNLQSLLGGLGGQSNGPGGMDLQSLLGGLGGQSNGAGGMNLQSLLGGLGGQSNGPGGMDLQSLLGGLGGQSNGPGGMNLQSLLSGLGGQGNVPSGINLQSLLAGLGGQSTGSGGLNLQSLLGSLLGSLGGNLPLGNILQPIMGAMNALEPTDRRATDAEIQSVFNSMRDRSKGPPERNLQNLLGERGGQDKSTNLQAAGTDLQSLFGGLPAQDRSTNIWQKGMDLLSWLSNLFWQKDVFPSNNNPGMHQSMSLFNSEHAGKLSNNDLALLLDTLTTLTKQPSAATDRLEGYSEVSDPSEDILVATDRSNGLFDSLMGMFPLGDGDDDDDDDDRTSTGKNPKTGLQKSLLGILANSIKNKPVPKHFDFKSILSSVLNTNKKAINKPQQTKLKSLQNIIVGNADRNAQNGQNRDAEDKSGQNEPGQVQVPATLLSRLIAGDKSPSTLAMVKQVLNAQIPSASGSGHTSSKGSTKTVAASDKSLSPVSGNVDRSTDTGELFSILAEKAKNAETKSIFGGVIPKWENMNKVMPTYPNIMMGNGRGMPRTLDPMMGMSRGTAGLLYPKIGLDREMAAPLNPMQTAEPWEREMPKNDPWHGLTFEEYSNLSPLERKQYYGEDDDE